MEKNSCVIDMISIARYENIKPNPIINSKELKTRTRMIFASLKHMTSKENQKNKSTPPKMIKFKKEDWHKVLYSFNQLKRKKKEKVKGIKS